MHIVQFQNVSYGKTENIFCAHPLLECVMMLTYKQRKNYPRGSGLGSKLEWAIYACTVHIPRPYLGPSSIKVLQRLLQLRRELGRKCSSCAAGSSVWAGLASSFLALFLLVLYSTGGTPHSLQSQNFLTFKGPKNRLQGFNSASLCSLAGRYDNPIPIWFLAPIDCLTIPAQYTVICSTTTVYQTSTTAAFPPQYSEYIYLKTFIFLVYHYLKSTHFWIMFLAYIKIRKFYLEK